MWRVLVQMLFNGRYGFDALGRFWLICGLLCELAAIIVRQGPLVLPLQITGFALMLLTVSRMFSRNIAARAAEARRFAETRGRWQKRLQNLHPKHLRQLRQYKFFSCPSCGARLRVPRHQGRLTITCPRCGHKMQGKS